jgi:peptidoglycan L-alanyl-D-glutamate endopeptidase CwlK
MTLGHEQEEFTKDVVFLVTRAWELGYSVRLGEIERTIITQEYYVKTGRSKTLDSLHLRRLAVDLVLLRDGKICNRSEIEPLGNYWESLNPKNRWGGSWRGLVEAGKSKFVDAPHFERSV